MKRIAVPGGQARRRGPPPGPLQGPTFAEARLRCPASGEPS